MNLVLKINGTTYDMYSAALHNAIKQLQAELATAKEENERLKEFARYVIETECWSIFEQDGGDLQELAEKLGLIVPHVVEIDDDYDVDFEVGETIFKFSETLQGE